MGYKKTALIKKTANLSEKGRNVVFFAVLLSYEETIQTAINSITYQLKLPAEISTIIEISDPVYTFCEDMDRIDLKKYLVAKESGTGRKKYNSEILL